jgi:hypothetical protein
VLNLHLGPSDRRLNEELGNGASVNAYGFRVGGIGDAEERSEWSVGGWSGRPVGDQEKQGTDGHGPYPALRLEFRTEDGGR